MRAALYNRRTRSRPTPRAHARDPQDPSREEARANPHRGRGRGRARAATGDSLNAYIREISKFKPLSGDEEKVLGRRIQQGDQEALQRLVEANLRFVVSYSKRYRGLGLAFLDLIHEGSLGLIEAAKRFDPERNVKFISYAVWWVRQAIFHALSEHTASSACPRSSPARSPRWATPASSWRRSWSARPPRRSWPSRPR